MVDMNLIKEGLNLSTLQLEVKIFKEIDSTNTEAKRCISENLKHDLLIVSSTQTAGRGRGSRNWFSPEGGLYFSLVVRPRLGPHFASLASLLSGCAVAKGLLSFGIDYVKLKWPNDVLVREDKIAGILNELISIDPVDTWMILGVGINQNIAIGEFPDELVGRTTSMLEILGEKTSPLSLLSSIIVEFDRLFRIVESEKSYSSILDLWRSMSNTLGRRIRVNDGSEVFTGIAEELLDDGSLVVLTENGREKITIGDVTHLRSD